MSSAVPPVNLPPVGAAVRLDRCPPLQPAIVVRHDALPEDADRLERLGVCAGRRVQVVRAGDPLILRVHGTRLGLSARLAERVWVEPCGICAPGSPGSKAVPGATT